jgi:hypothetical protein
MTCATVAYTDKGMFHPTALSKYPPRNDMTVIMPVDHEDMMMFDEMNDLDAISQPTPPADGDVTARTVLDLPDGEYVAFIEVSREFDQNQDHDYPSPVGIPWSEYGRAYRGQPSLVWSVPFTVNEGGGSFGSLDYAGYGEGSDDMGGTMHAPDTTINTEASRAIPHAGGDGVVVSARQWTFANGAFTQGDEGRQLIVTGASDPGLNGTFTIDQVVSPTRVQTLEVPAANESFGAGVESEVCCMVGSGALRLLLVEDPGGDYRFRVRVPARSDRDTVPPADPSGLSTISLTPTTVRVQFVEPGDDGESGVVTVYDIRYLAGSPLTDENFFSQGIAAPTTVVPEGPGTTREFFLTGLQPETHYWIGIRAADECLNPSRLVVYEIVTPAADRPPVDGCACQAGRSGAPSAALAGLVPLCFVLYWRRRRRRP